MGGGSTIDNLERMRYSLVSSVVTVHAAVFCSTVTCDAFRVHAARSTSLRFVHRTSSVMMKESASTADTLDDLRKVQKANGAVIGDARYEDGETLWHDVFVSWFMIALQRWTANTVETLL